MEDLANELQQWLRLREEPSHDVEVGDLAARTRLLMRPTIESLRARRVSIATADEAVAVLEPQLEALREVVAESYGSEVSETGYVDPVSLSDAGFGFQFCALRKADGVACREAFFTVNATSPASYQLRCGVIIQVMPDLQHRLHAHLVTNARGETELFWKAQRTVPPGTPQEWVFLSELIGGLTENMRPALERLNQLIEQECE